MFLIGEFSRLARVTRRQLRHYDELGLLVPDVIDPATGYRRYGADQLPRLHRILALKDLGFSLEEIHALVDGDVTPERLRGMLQLKRSQTQQALESEAQRLREIEARIAAVESPRPAADVVVRSVDGGRLASHRFLCDGPDHALEVIGGLGAGLADELGSSVVGDPVAIAHDEGFEETDIDLEVGFLVPEAVALPPALGALAVADRRLPPVERAAVSIRSGDPRTGHDAFGAIGRWLDLHGERLATPMRERFVRLPTDPSRLDQAVTEIQAPLVAVT